MGAAAAFHPAIAIVIKRTLRMIGSNGHEAIARLLCDQTKSAMPTRVCRFWPTDDTCSHMLLRSDQLMRFTEEHQQLRRTVRDFVEKEINPHVDKWERDGAFPAHEVLKKAGRLGLLGINKPEQYGGLGLDYSYQMVATEELGTCTAGAIPMAFGVLTDMATPALARWGTHELKQQYLAPVI